MNFDDTTSSKKIWCKIIFSSMNNGGKETCHWSLNHAFLSTNINYINSNYSSTFWSIRNFLGGYSTKKKYIKGRKKKKTRQKKVSLSLQEKKKTYSSLSIIYNYYLLFTTSSNLFICLPLWQIQTLLLFTAKRKNRKKEKMISEIPLGTFTDGQSFTYGRQKQLGHWKIPVLHLQGLFSFIIFLL